MTIESSNAQIRVEDSQAHAGVNVNRTASGYGADLSFWGGENYLAKRKDDPFMHVLVVPSARWLQDLKDEGWEIIGRLSDLLAQAVIDRENHDADARNDENLRKGNP